MWRFTGDSLSQHHLELMTDSAQLGFGADAGFLSRCLSVPGHRQGGMARIPSFRQDGTFDYTVFASNYNELWLDSIHVHQDKMDTTGMGRYIFDWLDNEQIFPAGIIYNPTDRQISTRIDTTRTREFSP